MGSESDKGDYGHEPNYSPTKKLSLLISRPSMPPEMPAPPPQTTVSVPFQWEEAPGKPRPCHTQSEPKSSARTLELPPRLLFSEAKVSNINVASPTTVLDGPYVGRAMSFTSSYRTPRDYWNANFGSARWSGFRKNSGDDAEGSYDFSRCTRTGSVGAAKSGAKIARALRRGSFWSLPQSQARSHLWASIYESFKQVVPWRRRRENQRKWASKIDTV